MLDDTKKLCLLSGDIIHMQATMSMVFEPMDLRAASPATVSRCGMVYLEPDKLGHGVVLQTWMSSLPNVIDQPHLPAYTAAATPSEHSRHARRGSATTQSKGFPGVTEKVGWDGTGGELPPGVCDVAKREWSFWDGMGVSCRLRYVMWLNENGRFVLFLVPPVHQELHSWLEAMWLYALVWGVAGVLDREGRRKFDSWLRSALNGELASQGIPRQRKIAIPFPNTGSVFDFKFDNQVSIFARAPVAHGHGRRIHTTVGHGIVLL